MRRPRTPLLVMGFAVAAILFGGGWSGLTSRTLGNPSGYDYERIQQTLLILDTTTAGHLILEKAKRSWKTQDQDSLLSYFRWGDVSRTDAVLTRRLNADTGREEKVRKVTIYLRQDQSQNDLLLDMAHELTHAAAEPAWDPYDPALTPAQYMWVTLENEGGEVDALTTECQVGLELKMVGSTSLDRCRRYVDEKNPLKPIREKVKADFYRVGKWQKFVEKRLGALKTRFPDLSDEPPQLFSSTGQAPYPVALILEYDEMTRVACDNSRKRIEKWGSRGAPTRTLASVGSSSDVIQNEALKFVEKRCRSKVNDSSN